MSTKNGIDSRLAIGTLAILTVVFLGSFFTEGNILDFLYVIVLYIYVFQYLKIQKEKSKSKTK